MKVQVQDLYHGAALTQVVEHRSFKALNKADSKFGHYKVNHDRRLLVKYTKADRPPWRFIFTVQDLETLSKDLRSRDTTSLCLVCGKTTVCGLDSDEIRRLLDLSVRRRQWVRAEVATHGRLRLRGSAGALKRTIAHTSFPKKLFK